MLRRLPNAFLINRSNKSPLLAKTSRLFTTVTPETPKPNSKEVNNDHEHDHNHEHNDHPHHNPHLTKEEREAAFRKTREHEAVIEAEREEVLWKKHHP